MILYRRGMCRLPSSTVLSRLSSNILCSTPTSGEFCVCSNARTGRSTSSTPTICRWVLCRYVMPCLDFMCHMSRLNYITLWSASRSADWWARHRLLESSVSAPLRWLAGGMICCTRRWLQVSSVSARLLELVDCHQVSRRARRRLSSMLVRWAM